MTQSKQTTKAKARTKVTRPKVSAAPVPKATKSTRAKATSSKATACLCGCGGAPKGSFLPGHDARLKSHLQRAFRGEADLPSAVATLHGTADPMTIAKGRGWERFLPGSKT
jgi:hypothetical protein